MLVHVFAEAVHEDLFGDRFLRVVKDVIGEDERLRHHRLYLFLLLLPVEEGLWTNFILCCSFFSLAHRPQGQSLLRQHLVQVLHVLQEPLLHVLFVARQGNGGRLVRVMDRVLVRVFIDRSAQLR